MCRGRMHQQTRFIPSSLLVFANSIMRVLSYMSFVVACYSLLLNHCHCLNLELLNVSKIKNEDAQWQNAAATWYGPPNGGGTDGGACGYGAAVENPPLSKMISAGGPSLFRGGRGCGACYEVKCRENGACSGNPVRVMISDECPGCNLQSLHFDLSGTAFGSMATPNNADNLRNAGQITIQYTRVACSFGKSMAFAIDGGSNPYYFATEIEYENGNGDLVDIELKQANSNTWLPMFRSQGSRWALNVGKLLQAPFSIKLTEDYGNNRNKTIVADTVIPYDWKPGQVYRSLINF
ncbi:putative expansin-B2 [Cajanus cajan]|uniref:putative expansin-B2 n=1 Tax=Cajanus cajan TaxID=3821 RepID=UPI0010FB7374|nr:putative expansin-B2 [Cajanus cajan]